MAGFRARGRVNWGVLSLLLFLLAVPLAQAGVSYSQSPLTFYIPSEGGGGGGGGGGGTPGNWSIVNPDIPFVISPGSVSSRNMTIQNNLNANITRIDIECIPSTCNVLRKCTCVDLCPYVVFDGNATRLPNHEIRLPPYSIRPNHQGDIPFSVDFTRDYAVKNNLTEIGYCTSPYSFMLAVTIQGTTQAADVTVTTYEGEGAFSKQMQPFMAWLGGSTQVMPREFVFGYGIYVPNWFLLGFPIVVIFILAVLLIKERKNSRTGIMGQEMY